MKNIVVTLFIFFMTSCSGDNSGDDLLLPSNLSVDITQQEGQVELEANADNANFYQFNFGDEEGFVRDDDGQIVHTYNAEGDYTITVRANATVNDFAEESYEVTITIDSGVDDEGYTTPMTYDGYTLVWNDEFNGTALSSDWAYEIGTGSNGWGNNELQYYREENTTVDDGYLIIEARKEAFSGSQYTSSRIVTQGTQSFQYGRIDIRAKLPEGQGLWPALWMLGSNFQTDGWPYCGEIDIMEMVGGSGRENTVIGTLHWDNNGSYACTCDIDHDYILSSGTFADEFHVFSIIWNQNQITWYVDDQSYVTVNFNGEMEEFLNDFFFIFNVAVGGNLPGSPDETTTFPQQMVVDYVRVFQPD